MQTSPSHSSDESLRAAAAAWIVRRDRGLSAAEAIEYELWLAADERHAAAVSRATAAWSLLDRLPESVAIPVLSAAARRRTSRRRVYIATGVFAAAAALVLGLFTWRKPIPTSRDDRTSVAISASAG